MNLVYLVCTIVLPMIAHCRVCVIIMMSFQGKDLDCVKVLLVFGANINFLNTKKQTPTDSAMECDAAVCGL